MKEVTLESITEASSMLDGIAVHTPLEYNKILSDTYKANIFLKREDLQPIRSYKIRGAFNLISGLTEQERKKGVVTASAGNHSQAVAYSCDKLGIEGVIFMPRTTPTQKRILRDSEKVI
jgi:threonine dehydratase